MGPDSIKCVQTSVVVINLLGFKNLSRFFYLGLKTSDQLKTMFIL